MEADDAAVLLGAHPHGYLVLVGDAQRDVPGDCRGWRVRPDLLPGTTLVLQPRTVVAHARGPAAGRVVVLLGHPVDVAAGLTDPAAIATRLAATWARAGTDALVEEAADLGGRWTLLAGAAGHAAAEGAAAAAASQGRAGASGPSPVPGPVELLVVPDTHASQPVHVGRTARGAAVASAPSLVAAALGLGVDERAVELLADLRERRAGRVTYLPGLRTAYLGVEALVPNSLLRVTVGTGGTRVEQRRFWPFRPRVARTDVDEVYAEFRDRFVAHATLLAGLGRPAVSLTGGLDSAATAVAAAPSVRAAGGFAFTYLNPRDAARGEAAVADVVGARDVARLLGVPHRVLRWRQPPAGGTFDVLHRRTYAPETPSRGAAHAMWADLPGDVVQLQSNGGETGTTFLRHRPDHVLTPRRLTELYLGSGAPVDDGLARELYGGYLDRVPMDPATLLGFDDYDVLYWEQRMGRWGWQKFVDGDFGHRILLPFNDRVLLETMLSLPYPLRHDRVLPARLVAEAGLPVPGSAVPVAPAAPTPHPGRVRSGMRRLRGALRRRAGVPVGRADGPAGGEQDRAGGHRAGRDGTVRDGVMRAFAVVPTRAAEDFPGALRTRPLPVEGLSLRAHPALPHAVVGDAGAWVLVLGEPLDVPDGLDGARPVARLLHRLLTRGPGLAAATVRAAGLCGSWVVVMAGPEGGRVLTDPLPSWDLRLGPDGRTLMGDPGPAADLGGGEGHPLGGDHLLRAGPPDPVPRWQVDELPDLAGAVAPGADAARRLAAHVLLLTARGRPVLGLGAGGSLLEVLPLLTGPAAGPGTGGGRVGAVTWWDPSSADSTRAMIRGGRRAFDAGVDQRLVLPGRGGPVDPGAALDAALGPDDVVWLGLAPGRRESARSVLGAVRPVRPVALPWSDRVLALLQGGGGPDRCTEPHTS